MVPEKIHTAPPEEIGSSRGDFGGGGGGRDEINIPNPPGERGCTKGKCFQWVLMACKRVTKERHKHLQQQFICEVVKHNGLP